MNKGFGNFIIIFFLGVYPPFIHSTEEPQTSKEFYEKGKYNLANKNYILALKYLYVFKILKKNRLNQPKFKEIKDNLEKDIEFAESKLITRKISNGQGTIFTGTGALSIIPKQENK